MAGCRWVCSASRSSGTPTALAPPHSSLNMARADERSERSASLSPAASAAPSRPSSLPSAAAAAPRVSRSRRIGETRLVSLMGTYEQRPPSSPESVCSSRSFASRLARRSCSASPSSTEWSTMQRTPHVESQPATVAASVSDSPATNCRNTVALAAATSGKPSGVPVAPSSSAEPARTSDSEPHACRTAVERRREPSGSAARPGSVWRARRERRSSSVRRRNIGVGRAANHEGARDGLRHQLSNSIRPEARNECFGVLVRRNGGQDRDPSTANCNGSRATALLRRGAQRRAVRRYRCPRRPPPNSPTSTKHGPRIQG